MKNVHLPTWCTTSAIWFCYHLFFSEFDVVLLEEGPKIVSIMSSCLDDVKKIIMVLSGKGGVGKSTTTVNLALSLAEKGKRVGLLDLDICGPSIALMLGFKETSIFRNDKGWMPLKTEGSNPISVISIAFLLQSEWNHFLFFKA